MKYLLLLPALLTYTLLMGQSNSSADPEGVVLVNNDKMRVIEHTSIPQGDVCGKGMHHHEPHLTVVLTDATVQIIPENGEPQEVEVKAGASLWFDAETHAVVNKGDQPTRIVLVYLKDD